MICPECQIEITVMIEHTCGDKQCIARNRTKRQNQVKIEKAIKEKRFAAIMKMFIGV